MLHFSSPGLLLVLAIVVILFGAGRIGKLGGELGSALREFRKGLNANDTMAEKKESSAIDAIDSTIKPE
ncbi:MAG: twin-arginine translocase TatA/TatE family subunit [Chloroflexota bacterium]